MVFHNPLDRSPPPEYKNKLKIKGTKLVEAKSFDFLGVRIDPDLKWDAHTDKVNSQVSRTLGILRKIKRVAPVSVLKTLYLSLIQTKFTYGIKAWGYAHAKVFKMQKKAVRVIALKKYNSHTDPIFIDFELLKIQDIFNYQTLILHYKIERELTPANISTFITRNRDVHQYHTRNYAVRTIHPNFQTHSDSMRYHLPKIIIQMPDEILQTIFLRELKTFKYILKKYFLSQYSVVCMLQNCPNCN